METAMRYTRCKCARKPLESDDSTGLNNWTSQSLPAGLQLCSAVSGLVWPQSRSALHSAAVRGRATLNSTVGYTSIGLAGHASCMNVHSNLSAVSAVTNGGPQHCSDYDRRCQYNDQFRTLKSNFSVCIE